MEASQHSLLAACFTLHGITATLAIVPQRGAGLWIICWVYYAVLEKGRSYVMDIVYPSKVMLLQQLSGKNIKCYGYSYSTYAEMHMATDELQVEFLLQ
jgi:hypothetical protein